MGKHLYTITYHLSVYQSITTTKNLVQTSFFYIYLTCLSMLLNTVHVNDTTDGVKNLYEYLREIEALFENACNVNEKPRCASGPR